MDAYRVWQGLLVFFAGFSTVAWASDRPNIVVMMADDLGFADLGCYGSEIETPQLNRLAEQGLRFSQFYNTAKCHSSRVSLLTGLYCDQAGSAELSRGATFAEALKGRGICDHDEWQVAPFETAHGFWF